MNQCDEDQTSPREYRFRTIRRRVPMVADDAILSGAKQWISTIYRVKPDNGNNVIWSPIARPLSPRTAFNPKWRARKNAFLGSAQLENPSTMGQQVLHALPADGRSREGLCGFRTIMGSGVLQQEAIWRHKYLLLKRDEYAVLIPAYFIMIMLLLVGCSSTTNNYENGPFPWLKKTSRPKAGSTE